MTSSLTPVVLNNMIIERLRSGSAEAVNSLKVFGVRPHMLIDEVLSNPSRTNRHSAWFWAHQASRVDGLEIMWGMMDHQLGVSEPSERLPIIAERLMEACVAGLSQANTSTLALSWSRMEQWCEFDGLSRKVMLVYLTEAICKLGDDVVPGLSDFQKRGLISPEDWSLGNRRGYGSDPLTYAIEHDCQKLSMLMLDLGCEPILVDGTHILTTAWSRLREEIKKIDIHIEQMASPLKVVESLLNKDIDWNVPSSEGGDRTVAQDACELIPLLSTRPYWLPLASQIERRILDENTALTEIKEKKQSSKKRPLRM